MPISLDYAQTRALSKKLRELTGRDISHSSVLEAIATITGMPMDGMMHMLKTETRAAKTAPTDENPWDRAWKPGGSTLKTFDAIPKHPSMEVPDFEMARPIFELMIRTAPRRTRYSFVLVQIDNLEELEQGRNAAGVSVRLADGLRRYVEENNTLAACTRNGEFAILLEDVDAMDEEDETLGWFSKALPFRRQPDQPEVMITALVTDVEFNDPNEDPMLLERIEVTRESFKEYNEMRSQMRFVWGPAGF
ncbi:hypothetical protein D3C71_277920 [compost metagenome]